MARGELGWYVVGIPGSGQGIFVQAFGPTDATRQAHLRDELDLKPGVLIGVAPWRHQLPPSSMLNRRLDADGLVELARLVKL